MSIQDDIFDIEAALKRKPAELAAFEKLCNYFFTLEEENDQLRGQVYALKQTVRILGENV